MLKCKSFHMHYTNTISILNNESDSLVSYVWGQDIIFRNLMCTESRMQDKTDYISHKAGGYLDWCALAPALIS